MYFISSHKKGISSYQLARNIEVTQNTAWYMLQKVRLLYPQTDAESFNGTVECDEVYIGGKEKWKHKSMRTPKTQGRSTKTKTPVFGMMERSTFTNSKGEEEPITYVHAIVVEKTDRATLQPIIQQFVAEGSRVITDELAAYNGLATLGYTHAVVAHGAEEYANGDVFTNSIEGFWSHFRRMIVGCYHDVSDEHLQQYIDEAVYRWNTRKMSESERFAHMFDKSIGLVRKWSDIRVGLMVA
jgi:transposase-like protein